MDALGGVYAASVTVQSEGLQATDDLLPAWGRGVQRSERPCR